jgi:hypothetical protein
MQASDALNQTDARNNGINGKKAALNRDSTCRRARR